LKRRELRTLLVGHREWVVCQPYCKCSFCANVTFVENPPSVCPKCLREVSWSGSFDHFTKINCCLFGSPLITRSSASEAASAVRTPEAADR
jgi:hypothetical protein